jgi:hypothetical protein
MFSLKLDRAAPLEPHVASPERGIKNPHFHICGGSIPIWTEYSILMLSVVLAEGASTIPTPLAAVHLVAVVEVWKVQIVP